MEKNRKAARMNTPPEELVGPGGAAGWKGERVMAEGREAQEKVLAETELLAGAKFSIVRDEHGDYFTEYREGGRASRDYQRSVHAALERFAEAVLDEESASLETGV